LLEKATATKNAGRYTASMTGSSRRSISADQSRSAIKPHKATAMGADIKAILRIGRNLLIWDSSPEEMFEAPSVNALCKSEGDRSEDNCHDICQPMKIEPQTGDEKHDKQESKPGEAGKTPRAGMPNDVLVLHADLTRASANAPSYYQKWRKERNDG